MPHSIRRSFLLALALSFAALPAAGTTYVMMSDEALVDQSPLIVVGTVVASQADSATSSTLAKIDVTEVLKGRAASSPLLVRVPGFVGASEALIVPGAPRFSSRERVLLFLAPRSDGTWAIQQFLLGAFHEAARGEQRLAVRELAGATALPSAGRLAAETPRDFARFAEWIRQRNDGRPAVADYQSPGPYSTLRSLHDDFVLLGMARWQTFDSAGSEAWEFHSAGYDGAGAGAGDFAAARGVWNADGNSTVSYTSGGSTASTGPGLNSGDGSNRIIFGDPNNEIAGSFTCGQGGVLGIGGYRTSGSHSHKSQTFGSTSEGDVVIQDGSSCFFAANPGSAEDVFTHELGHTLGLGHSPDSSAIMFASALPPYQGVLGDDDEAGICFLYGSNCPSTPPPTAPAAPSFLAASPTSTSIIHLTWNDNSDNETSFRIEMRPSGGGSFTDIGSTGANTVAVNITGLLAGTSYDFRVRARNFAGDSAYSNIASATTIAGASAPNPPSSLSAVALSSISIQLAWLDNSTNETAFAVEQKVGLTFVEIGTVGANSTAVNVNGLSPNTSYTFRVKARNAGGDSNPTNEASATTLPAAVTPPAAPSNLQAVPASVSQINLSWNDNASNEDSYRIEMRTGAAAFAEVSSTAPNATSFSVGSLTAGTSYEFRVRARNVAGDSTYSSVASAATPQACGDLDPDTVCLNGGRFEVSIAWETPDSAQGVGHPVALTEDSAYFWFFLPDNIEVVAKVLDGCAINNSFWVFATGLTNVKTTITVRDTLTQQEKTYFNNQGQAFQPLQDTSAFATCGAGHAPPPGTVSAAPRPSSSATVSAAACATETHALCLQGGRFRVEADWRTQGDQSGQGTAVPLTGDSGYFWFFGDSNIELVVKVLDACGPFDRFWVFAGGLTNVEVVLRVTDTSTGQVRTYTNPLNEAYLPLQDANAFDTCP